MFTGSSIKVAVGFSVVRNLAVTTHLTISYSRVNYQNSRVLSLHLDVKITFSLQYRKSLSIVHPGLALDSSESLSKYGKTKVNPFLATVKLRVLLINYLFKSTKFWG